MKGLMGMGVHDPPLGCSVCILTLHASCIVSGLLRCRTSWLVWAQLAGGVRIQIGQYQGRPFDVVATMGCLRF
jgi:hypothetical protein